MRIKLSQQFMNNNLHCPEGKHRIEFCDTELPGLYIEVRATSPNEGTFYLRYKDLLFKTSHKKIARTTEITLAEARKKAKALKHAISTGKDPRGEEKARLAVLTFSEFFEQHYLPYVKPRKRSWKRDEELYRLRIKKVFGHKRINEITRQQIQLFHTALKNEGLAAATCNHHIKLMKHSFNLAGDWEILLDSKNPVSRVPLFYEDNKIEHYMDDVELERLLMVLHNDENRPICQIALFLLASGVRLNELLSAKWSDVDMSKGVFTIRATNAKSKKLRGVPLNESAKEILNQLDTQGKFEYLFINRLTGMPYRNVHKVWNRLREKAGLKHLRLHDLRHQYASFLVNSGRTLYEVQQILGHSTSVVTQRYSHLSTKVLNEAAQSASVKIREATTNSV